MSTFVKRLFQTFDLVPFFLTLDIFCLMSFCLVISFLNRWFWTGKYWLGRVSKRDDACHFHINCFSSFFRPLVFRVIQFIGDTTLFRITILKQTYKRKKKLKMTKSITRSNFLMVNKNERFKICFYWYFGLFPETIFKV